MPIWFPGLSTIVTAAPGTARRFHAKWGDWPMSGGLEAFAERGLVDRHSSGSMTGGPAVRVSP